MSGRHPRAPGRRSTTAEAEALAAAPTRKAPPEVTRFQKGQSGNPKGRPKGSGSSTGGRTASGAGPDTRSGPGSTFEVILERTLTVTQGGRERALGMDEALQLRTYQAALGGSRPATRAVLQMITRREKAIAAKAQRRPRRPVEVLFEPTDPSNADATMLLLGIAAVDDRHPELNEPVPRIRLEPWAVQMALTRRRGGSTLSDREVGEITRSTREAETLVWPRRRER